MRSLLLTSVATAALLTGLAAAGAQQDQGRRGDPPSATEQTQPPPRARNNVKEWPGSQVQQPERQGPSRAQPERSTTGQSTERPADQPRMQRGQGQGDARERSTTGQSSPADQPRMQRERAGEDRSRSTVRERTTTRQSQDRSTRQPSRDVTRETPRRGESRQRDTAQDRATQDRTTQDRGSRAERRGESTARGSVRMSDEQRTRVSTRFSQSIDRMNVRPLSRSQVSVSIGATIPRSVRAYTVPQDIVAIYPQFRGHRFVVVDDEIVILEPGSQRIVSVLPMGGERSFARSTSRETTGAPSRETTGSASAGSRLRLSSQDREVIRTVVMREPACRLEQRVDFFLFIPLPRTVEVCELPPQVVSEAPELRGYRYVVRGDEIGLVDPDENRIVEVIR
jgi:hypothetical protein